MTTAPLPHAPSGPGAEFDLVVRAGRAITPAGQRPVEIGVRDGVITAIEDLGAGMAGRRVVDLDRRDQDRKSTRLNSSHVATSYAVFCLKKKKKRTHASGPTGCGCTGR